MVDGTWKESVGDFQVAYMLASARPSRQER